MSKIRKTGSRKPDNKRRKIVVVHLDRLPDFYELLHDDSIHEGLLVNPIIYLRIVAVRDLLSYVEIALDTTDELGLRRVTTALSKHDWKSQPHQGVVG